MPTAARAQVPPHITFSTTTGSYIGASPLHEIINVCVSTTLDSVRIRLNGTDVTSSFRDSTASCSGGTQHIETGSVSLTFGHDSLWINACEVSSPLGPNDVCTTAWITFTYTHGQVTPRGTAVSGHVAQPAAQAFQVQNLTASAVTFNLTTSCSGSGVSACTTASKIRVTANATATDTVHFTAGALNSTGVVKLIAVDSAQTAAVDTGSINYTAKWLIPEIISTAYTNQEDQEPSRCIASCFAVQAAISTVPFISQDSPNAVTLVYNSDLVAVRPVLYADVKIPSSSPYSQNGFELSAKYHDLVNGWLQITFLHGGDQVLKFAAVSDTATYRLAGQFDASGFTTNHGQAVYPLMMQIVTKYSDHSDTLIDSTHHLVIMNTGQSSVAKGWSIAGVSGVNWCATGPNPPCQDYMMHFGADGSSQLDGPVACFSWGCNWSPIGGDNFAFLHFVNNQGAWYIFPDSTREFINPSGYMTYRVLDAHDTVFYGYDAQNRDTSISDPFWLQPSPNNTKHTYWRITYGAHGVATITDPDFVGNPGAGRTTTISVDTLGFLRSWTDPDGGVTKFGYDSKGFLDSITDRKGSVTTFTYDTSTRKLTKITSPSIPIDNAGTGSPTSQRLVEALTPWQTTGVPIGTTSTTPWTPVKLINVVAADSTAIGKTTFTVDRWGQPLTLTDPTGKATTFTRNADGFATAVTYPTGASDQFGWSGPYLISSKPAGQTETDYQYGSDGQVTKISGTGQPTQTFAVSADGHTDSMTVNGSTWRYYANGFGQDTQVVDAQHDTTKYRYDQRTGSVDSVISWPSYRFNAKTFDTHGRYRKISASSPGGPLVVTTTAYDSANRVVSVTDGLHANPTTFTYDSLFLTGITDPAGQQYRSTSNALGWAPTETDTANRTISATYNNLGLPTTLTNRRTQRVQMLYDTYGRLTKVTRPSTEPDSIDGISYDTSGYVITDSNRVVKDVTYNSRTTGLPDSVITTFRVSGHWFKRAYSRDAQTRLVRVTITTNADTNFMSRTTGYNSTTGLIDSLDLNNSTNRLTFGYDSLFRLSSVHYPGGVVRTDSYFASGQLATTNWSSLLISRGYGYDSTGRVSEVDYNGTQKGDTAALYTYDVLGELVQRQLQKWTDTLASCPSGQLQNGFGCRAGSSRSDSVIQTVNYSYDAAGNLDTVKVGPTDSVATILPGNRLNSWTGMTFVGDSDGNRVTKTVGSTSTSYTWGADGRLLSVTRGSATRSYDYDPSGLLVQRKTNGTVDRYYLWDHGQLLAVLDGTATHRLAEFVYFGGGDQPMARITGPIGADTIHYYAQDGSGNVIAQFSGTTIEQGLSYDPWGAATGITVHGDTTQLRWKGLLYEDSVTSLYYVRARWYDPVTRRFVSADPLSLAAGVNQYAYAAGDPINGSDPTGTCAATELMFTDGVIGEHVCAGVVDLGMFGQLIVYFYIEPISLPTVDVTATGGWAPPTGGGATSNSPFQAPTARELGGAESPGIAALGKVLTPCNGARANFALTAAGDLSFAFGVGEIVDGVKAARLAFSSTGKSLLLSSWLAGTDAFKKLAAKYAAQGSVYGMIRNMKLGMAAQEWASGLPTTLQTLDLTDVDWRDFVPIIDGIKAWKAMKEACSSRE